MEGGGDEMPRREGVEQVDNQARPFKGSLYYIQIFLGPFLERKWIICFEGGTGMRKEYGGKNGNQKMLR